MNIKEKIRLIGAHLIGVAAQEQDHHNPEKIITPGMPELLRSVAAQGAVLLENRVLPLQEGSRVSVFGRVQCDYFYTGYGSGGDVNFPYSISLLEGLRNCESIQVNENLAKAYELWIQANPANHGVWGTWPPAIRKCLSPRSWWPRPGQNPTPPSSCWAVPPARTAKMSWKKAAST